MSVVTVMLWVITTNSDTFNYCGINITTTACPYSYGYISSNFFTAFDLKVGGLNETEVYDLRQLPSPFDPLPPDVERFGAWTASFRVSGLVWIQMLSEPPVDAAAPYLSRIKSWGYKITFYNSYIGEINQPIARPYEAYVPIFSHMWILEK